MRILKPVFYSAVSMLALASCKSISNIPVPVGSDMVVNIPSKKAELTELEQQNWQHLDLATDTIPGMSVNKAYDFLKGKKSVEVVVGILDSGTDLKHEDLKDVAWTNKGEVEGNNIDDDKNGYVDDITGWNFLGDVYKENLEYERVLQNPSIADETTVKEVNDFIDSKKEEAQKSQFRYTNILAGIKFADAALKDHFGKDDYTFEEVEAIKTDSEELKNAIDVANGMSNYFSSLKSADDYLSNEVDKAKRILNGGAAEKNYRTPLGDNPEDINDGVAYGNGNTGHSIKDEAHGSHVSGIVGASRNNGKGMNGVADNVKIMAIRAVPDGDEYDKDIALGIRYAVDNGAKVINCSFGKDFSPHKDWVFDAIKYAAKKDVLIVNAAGNSSKNIDEEKTFPNDSPDFINEVSDNFITVGSIRASYDINLISDFSNYGKKNVDVFAPGHDIYSTTPENGYKKFSGTSMASPNTAGVAALVRSYYPELSASQVKHILMNSGTKVNLEVVKPGSEDQVPFSELSVSGRIVNAYNALKMADRMVNSAK